MSSIKDIIKNIPESANSDEESNSDDIMLNPEYLRHSSAIISEALQKGFDVLQLENGDIVTTGTKVIITQYHWDGEADEMIKMTAKERKEAEKTTSSD